MTSPIALTLIGYMAWTLALLVLMETIRAVLGTRSFKRVLEHRE